MKRVSILIPLYNAAPYVEETIASALAQTYPNIEIIVVDDGSTDNSLQLAEKLSSENVHVFSQPNKGACAARNLAYEHSTGEYIQYLDADDLLAPDKIEQQIAALPADASGEVLSCRWASLYEDKQVVEERCTTLYKNYDNPLNWLADAWMGKGMFPYHVWLTPRKLIAQAGPWNESLLLNQDGEFFSRVLSGASAIKYCPETAVYYRKSNPQSQSQGGKFSRAKAASLLDSYKLYISNVAIYLTNENILKALGNNLLLFIYQYHQLFPDLSYQAEEAFQQLGFKHKWPVGGAQFKKMAIVLGFKNALRLKALIQHKY
ncbi:glycosyltransferase family A protein [Cesiribacter sp. SM1]|uniref:glycosyltransferase family 2 protein n=1 Tax=Cesiribacter sp. SM1 TaxID=2861196 RepID=UPI001CD2A4F0|nr:glycosyltransferase family A protein [Cesiribacter sp. SM1]